jgi:hypothetical protein
MEHKLLAFDRKKGIWGEVFQVEGSETELIKWPNGSTSVFEGRYHTKAISDSPGYWRLQDAQVNRNKFLETPSGFLRDVILLSLEKWSETFSALELKNVASQVLDFDFKSPAAHKGPNKELAEQYSVAFSSGLKGLKEFVSTDSEGKKTSRLHVPSNLRIKVTTTVKEVSVKSVAEENVEVVGHSEPDLLTQIREVGDSKAALKALYEKNENLTPLLEIYFQSKLGTNSVKSLKKNLVSNFIEICIEFNELSSNDNLSFRYFAKWLSKPASVLQPLSLVVLNADAIYDDGLPKELEKGLDKGLLRDIFTTSLRSETGTVWMKKMFDLFYASIAPELDLASQVKCIEFVASLPSSQQSRFSDIAMQNISQGLIRDKKTIAPADFAKLPQILEVYPWSIAKKKLTFTCFDLGLNISTKSYWKNFSWKDFEAANFAKDFERLEKLSGVCALAIEAILSSQDLELENILFLYKLGPEIQEALAVHFETSTSFGSKWAKEYSENEFANRLLTGLFGLEDAVGLKKIIELQNDQIQMRETELLATKKELDLAKAKLQELNSNLDRLVAVRETTNEEEVAKASFSLASLNARILDLLGNDLGRVPNEQIVAMAVEYSRVQGISPIGVPGEEVEFNPETHKAKAHLAQNGDLVKIVRVGYRLVGKYREYVLLKSEVAPTIGI